MFEWIAEQGLCSILPVFTFQCIWLFIFTVVVVVDDGSLRSTSICHLLRPIFTLVAISLWFVHVVETNFLPVRIRHPLMGLCFCTAALLTKVSFYNVLKVFKKGPENVLKKHSLFHKIFVKEWVSMR